MSILRALARAVLGDYRLFRIYAIDPGTAPPPADNGTPELRIERLNGTAELERSRFLELRELTQYEGEEAFCFVARYREEIVAACWFWAGATYLRRNFWPLQAGEAKLIQITTAEEFRGRAIAGRLLRHASTFMATHGYRRLYARIWHSNRPSLRAFEGAGWRYTAFVAEVQPFGIMRTLRFVRRT